MGSQAVTCLSPRQEGDGAVWNMNGAWQPPQRGLSLCPIGPTSASAAPGTPTAPIGLLAGSDLPLCLINGATNV